jgi:hypothetical protein
VETNIQPQVSAVQLIKEINRAIIWLTDNVIELHAKKAVGPKDKRSATVWFDQFITRLQEFYFKLRDPDKSPSIERVQRIAATLKYELMVANVHSAYYELPLFDTGVKLIDSNAGLYMVVRGRSMEPSIYPGSVIQVKPIDQIDYSLATGKLVALAYLTEESRFREWVLGRLSEVTETSLTISYDNPGWSNITILLSSVTVLAMVRYVSVIPEDGIDEKGEMIDRKGGQDHD